MSDGIKVDYTTLNECIDGLKTITVQVGGDEITKLIASLDNVFSETNSDTANKLHSVKEKYNTVNNSLVAIARNGIDVLELAMKAYEDADANMQAQIDASSGAGVPEGSGYATGGGGSKTRIFREATQQDVDLINDIKAKYNAGKTRNAVCAKGTINGENIYLECISGKFSHDNYHNKGNFEPPQPEDYHYKGPIPEYINHTEQKIIEYLREQFKDNPNVSGEIEIISERIYCDNCKVLVDMFENEFPNIKVIRVEVKKGD